MTKQSVKNTRFSITVLKYTLDIASANVNAIPDFTACRVRGCTTSGRYVRILDFRHFERHMMFSQSDRKTYKKAISDGVNVSVVLDVGCGNT